MLGKIFEGFQKLKIVLVIILGMSILPIGAFDASAQHPVTSAPQTGDRMLLTRFCSTPADLKLFAERVALDGEQGYLAIMGDTDINCFAIGWPGHNYNRPLPSTLLEKLFELDMPDRDMTLEFWSSTVVKGRLNVNGVPVTTIYSWQPVFIVGVES